MFHAERIIVRTDTRTKREFMAACQSADVTLSTAIRLLMRHYSSWPQELNQIVNEPTEKTV